MGIKSWNLFKEYSAGEDIPWYLFPLKNRYCRIVLYAWTIFLTSVVYVGWQPLSSMFYRHGVYNWLCPADHDFDAEPYCDEQYTAVQTLYTTALTSEFSLSAVAGILYDNVGPQITGIIGETTFISGWIMLIVSSQSLPLYIPAMICIGGAVNLNAFPTLVVSDFFPSRSGMAISFVVACQTASTLLPQLMEIIWDANSTWSFNTIIWGYLLAFVLPSVIMFILALPTSRAKVAAAYPNPAKSLEGAVADVSSPEPLKIKASKDDDSSSTSSKSSSSTRTKSISPSGSIWTKEGQKDKQSKTDFTLLLKEMLNPQWLLFLAYYTLQILQYGYFPTTTTKYAGDEVANFQGWFMPTQFIWGIVFGLVVDYIKTVPICLGLVISISMAYLFALWPTVTGLQYVATILYVVSNAYIYTVKYTFCEEVFSPVNFGILVGIIGTVAGVLNLINIPVQNADNYTPTCIAYLVVGGVCVGIIVILWVLGKKSKASKVAEKGSPDAANSKAALV